MNNNFLKFVKYTHRKKMTSKPVKHSWLERKYFSFYLKHISGVKTSSDEDVYIISPNENKEIRKLTRTHVVISALVAIAGVCSYYFPYYNFSFFKSIVWEFNLIGFHISFEVIAFFYGILLSYIEVHILVLLNIHALYRISLICGFPQKGDPDFENQVFDLITLGMERNDRRIKEYRINPYKGTSLFTIFLFWVYVNIKQTVSNKIAKFILRVLLGRYALRKLIDMVGIPIYASWNAYGTLKVIRLTRIRIVAPRYIDQFCQYIYNKNANNQDYRDFLIHSLQYITVAKYNYHFAHFLMAKKMLDRFGLTINMDPLDTAKYEERYKELDKETKKDVLNTLILGMIIDGHFSKREHKMLQHLDGEMVKPETIKEIKMQALNIRKNNQIKYVF